MSERRSLRFRADAVDAFPLFAEPNEFSRAHTRGLRKRLPMSRECLGTRLIRLVTGPAAMGVIAQFLSFGVSLVLLPLILSRLSPFEIGLWYVFLAIQAMVAVLDFGFTATIARNYSYVLAGATSLAREGLPLQGEGVNRMLFCQLTHAVRRLYLGMALTCLGVMSICGTIYVSSLAGPEGHTPENWAAWWLIVLTSAGAVYLQWQSALLTGANRVHDNYKITVASRLVQLLISGVGLILSPGLLVLAAGFVASLIVIRISTYVATRSILLIQAGPPMPKEALDDRQVVGLLWHNASRLGLAVLGGFLITRLSMLVVAYFNGVEESASYAIALQCFQVITSTCMVVLYLYLPRISAARVRGDLGQVRVFFARSMMFSWSVFLGLTTVLIVAGPALLELINAKTHLPPYYMLLLMALVSFLERNHSDCAQLIATGNKLPFVTATLLSGLIIAAGLVVAGLLGAPIIAFVAVQGTVQAAYNNWKWPSRAYSEIGLKLSQIPRTALKQEHAI